MGIREVEGMERAGVVLEARIWGDGESRWDSWERRGSSERVLRRRMNVVWSREGVVGVDQGSGDSEPVGVGELVLTPPKQRFTPWLMKVHRVGYFVSIPFCSQSDSICGIRAKDR